MPTLLKVLAVVLGLLLLTVACLRGKTDLATWVLVESAAVLVNLPGLVESLRTGTETEVKR